MEWLRQHKSVTLLCSPTGFPGTALPAAPGLGLRFDKALAGRFPYIPRDTPHPTQADGAVADW